MATVTTHLNARGALRRTLFILLAAGSAAIVVARNGDGHAAVRASNGVVAVSVKSRSSSGAPSAYGWPLKPFGRPHFVRAYFNDPRIEGSSKTFHFGIDIAVSTQGRTPVYAVASGTARLANRHAIMVWGSRAFGYWHVDPVVRAGQFVRKHQLIGMSMKGWNHLHFGEYAGRRWVNPLRSGGLGPFIDTTVPTVRKVIFQRSREALNPERVSGTCSLVLVAYDTASSIRPAPWPVTPALIRWRIARSGRPVTGWKTVIDSRGAIRSGSFASVYAPGTKQNHPGHPGEYRFNLAHAWTSGAFRDGSYMIEIRASDTRANTVIARLRFVIENR
jgi:murein DD-endopeptidase MepM/ murein hydrolase activator NlpD